MNKHANMGGKKSGDLNPKHKELSILSAGEIVFSRKEHMDLSFNINSQP